MPTTDLDKLSRKVIRYWCFRLSTEATGGAVADAVPTGLREHFEILTWFPGWATFGVTWDVVHDKPLEIAPIGKSLESAWDAEAVALAKELPVQE